MSDRDSETGGVGALSREETQSARFAQLVVQQSNLALMLLGRLPHPESGRSLRDLDAAKLFIDQLEMLKAKTTGNLNQQEATLLKQSLMSLHLAFVEAANSPASKPGAPAATPVADPTSPASVAGEAPAAKPSSD